MRVGIVCPYSFDTPGGVQFHVRDLAQELIARGHDVSVLAPADEGTPLPPYVVGAGRSIPIHYNGSVARLNFGPITATRTRRWLNHGEFDLLHIHEPITPSLGMIALLSADVPVVATFHSSQTRSRAMTMAYPLVRSSMEKITASIAVSEDARRTLIEHLGGDAVVIPNGVYVESFRNAEIRPEWASTPERPTVSFLGRLDEPRKGLKTLFDAVGQVRKRLPSVHFLVAGKGDASGLLAELGEDADAVEMLGGITDQEKAQLFASTGAYIAPQTGGESFGIVLVEAMAAGCPVIASNLGAFRRVLDDGESGRLFTTGDPDALARNICQTFQNPEQTDQLVRHATETVERYDWSTVCSQILAVYETVLTPEELRGRDSGLWGSIDAPH